MTAANLLCLFILLVVFVGVLREYRRQKSLPSYRADHQRRPR